MSQTVVSPAPRASGRFRGRVVALLAAGVIGAGLWGTGACSFLFNEFAQRAIQRDHLDEAFDWLIWSGACRDGNPETHFWRARVSRKLGLIDEFVAERERFVNSGGDRTRARRETSLAKAHLGEAQGLVQELADLLVEQDGDGDEICEAFANGFLIQNDYQQAFVLIEQWKQSFPNDPRPHFANGRVQDHLNNWPAAEKEYRDALAKQPDHYPSAYNLARLLLVNNHPADALPLFERSLGMRYNAIARIGIAKCQRQVGQTDLSRQTLTDVLREPAEHLSLSYQRLGEKLEGNPAAAELGSLELSAGRFASALKFLSIAHQANPRDLDVRYARALALRQAGQVAEGAQEIEAANAARAALVNADQIVDKLNPLQPQVEERLQVGEIYLRHGSLKTAEFWLTSALAHAPDSDRGRALLKELRDLQRLVATPTASPSSTTAQP